MIPGIISQQALMNGGAVIGPGDPLWNDVVLLMGYNGADGATTMIDESSFNRSMAARFTAQLDTADPKFGTAALLLDGDSDVVTAEDSADFHFASAPFTVEMFIKPASLSGLQFLVGQWYTSGTLGWIVYLNGSELCLNLSDNGTTNTVVLQGGTITAAVWQHVCIDFDGTTYRAYINGTVVDTDTTVISINDSTQNLAIGANSLYSQYYYGGLIDELRITRAARYAGAFTPPAEAFPRSLGGTQYASFSARYKDPKLALSNNNLTVTHAGTDSVWGHCGMFDAKASGKWYCEVTCNFVPGTDFGVAVGNYKAPLSLDYLGHSNNSIMYCRDGRILKGNSNQGGGPGAMTTGDVVCIALDADNDTVRFKLNGGGWTDAYALGGGGAYMLMIQMYYTGDAATANFGATPFVYAPYTGHVAWTKNAPPTGARYWRYHTVWGDTSGSGQSSIAEIQLRSTLGGADETGSGTPSQLTTFSSPTYTADKAVDNDAATIAHCANNQGHGWWWQYDFGSEKDIVQMSLTMRNDIVQYAREWHLVYSNDLTDFFPVVAKNADTFTQGETKIYNFA